MAKILIADDSSYARSLSKALLEEMGHEAVEANDGVQAVQVFKEVKPDAVLLDITMPVMDGLGALREIIAVDQDAQVAIITATGQERILIEAIKIGARDFVMKPFDADRVKTVVDALLNKSEFSEATDD